MHSFSLRMSRGELNQLDHTGCLGSQRSEKILQTTIPNALRIKTWQSGSMQNSPGKRSGRSSTVFMHNTLEILDRLSKETCCFAATSDLFFDEDSTLSTRINILRLQTFDFRNIASSLSNLLPKCT